MAIWVSVATAASRLSTCLEKGLRETIATGSDLEIVSFRFDPARDRAETEQALIEVLNAGRDIVGLLMFEPAALKLLTAVPRDLRVIFAPAELSQWSDASTTAERAQIIKDILSLKSFADRLEVCAPQTTPWSSLASTIFPSKNACAPLPIAAPAALPAWDIESALSIGFLDGMSTEAATLAARFLSELIETSEGMETRLRVFIPQQSSYLPALQPFRTHPRIEFAAGELPRDRNDAGGDFLLIVASDFCRLGENLIWGYRAGATLLVVDLDAPTGGVRLFDSAGQPVSISEFATSMELRSRLHRDHVERSARLLDSATAVWQRLLLSPPAASSEASQAGLADAPLFAALTAQTASADHRQAERRFLAAPGSPQTILNSAAMLAIRNDNSKWRLISLAHKAARSAGTKVLRPQNLRIEEDDLYIDPQDNPAQASELRAWLNGLALGPPVSSAEAGSAKPTHREMAASSAIVYSLGLSPPRDDAARSVSNTGCLMLVDQGSAQGDVEVGLSLLFVEGTSPPACRFAVTAGNAAPRPVSISAGGARELRIRCRSVLAGSIGIPVTIGSLDQHCADRLMLAGISVRPAAAEAEDLSPPGTKDFETLYSCSIERDVFSGAFDLEYDANGVPFRWVSRNFAFRLPMDRLDLPANVVGANRPWFLMRLARHVQTDDTLLSAKITLRFARAELRTITCRRVGYWCDELVFGAPLGAGIADGIVRVSLSEQGAPLSEGDRRIAAARMTGAWIARPLATRPVIDVPALTTLNLYDATQFADGWGQVEQAGDVPSRRMARRAILSAPIVLPPHTSVCLVLTGNLPAERPATPELSVMLDGQPMKQRTSTTDASRWIKLFEGALPEDAFGQLQFQLEARDAGNPVSIHRAEIVYPLGAGVRLRGDNRGDASLLSPSLGWENWEGGLSGVWLPSHATLVAVRRPNTHCIVLEGAAATDSHAVSGLRLEIDGTPARLEGVEHSDGGWSLTSQMPDETDGTCYLLRIETPDPGKVLLRQVQFR